MQNNNYFDLSQHELKGVNLIEASAGTGKTYNIAGLFLRFLLEKKMTIRDILVVTFSEAATEELKDRIRKAIGVMLDLVSQKLNKKEIDEEDVDQVHLDMLEKVKGDYSQAALDLKRALVDFDEANIFTIHGFCQRMLNENAFESGVLFDVELITNEDEIRKEIVEDFWRKEISQLPVKLIKLLLDAKITTEYLSNIASQVFDLSNIRIIPEMPAVDLNKVETEWPPLFKKLGEIWSAHSEEILRDFGDADRFHKAYYEKIGNDFINLDTLLKGPAAFTVFEGLNRFTMPVIEKSIMKSKKGNKPPEDKFRFFETAGELYKLQQEYLSFPFSIKIRFIKYVEKELRERKLKKNVQSFNDLLINLRDAIKAGDSGLRLAEAIRTKYKAALIDEFQDTDPVQFEIFRTIFAQESNILFLIGDPKQAIYGFRGADIFAYLKASQDTRYLKKTLGINFRSQDNMIEAVNLIFAKSKPFKFDEIQYYEIASPVEEDKKADKFYVNGSPYTPMHIWNMTDQIFRQNQVLYKLGETDSFGYCVAAEIKRLLNLGKESKAMIGDRKVEEKDFAILVRTNDQAAMAQKKLTEFGIPSVIYNSGNIFKSHEAVELERVLSCIAEPGNMGLVRAALATDLMGIPCEYIDSLAEDESRFEPWLERFKRYNKKWHSGGFIMMFRELLNDEIETGDNRSWQIMPHLMTASDGERRNTNILHLMELLHQAETDERLSPQGLIKWFHERMNEEDSDKEEHQMRLESDEKAVKVVTIHKSKGLEYSIVFLPYMWKGTKDKKEFRFHDRNNSDKLTWELGSPDLKKNKDAFKDERLAEDLRLFYVAVTRAKNCCYIALNGIDSKSTRSGVQEYIFNDEEIKRIVSRANGNVVLCDIPVISDPRLLLSDEQKQDELQERQMKKAIDKRSLIASYTSLSRRFANANIPVEIESISEIDQAEETAETNEENKYTKFTFNKGQRSGICLHEILEKADYTSADLSEFVREKLERHRFKPEFTHAVCDMIGSTLSKQLDGGVMLKEVPAGKRLHEMEFYFPLGTICSKKLTSIFKEVYSEDPRLCDFHKYLNNVREDEIEGFMNGFLDLLFELNGRYYIADWKSNHLGMTETSYAHNMILHAMKDELYILQYHIYCVAVHQYLSSILSSYDYERDFGGVYYLFLRGIGNEAGTDNGIFYHKPPKLAIEKLTEYLTGTK